MTRRLPPRQDEVAQPGLIRLVSAALWLAFLGLLVRPFVADIGLLRNASRFLGELSALILIAVGLFVALRQRTTDDRNLARRWTLLMLAVCLPPAVAGLVLDNKLVAWAQLGFFPFVTAAAIVLGAQRQVVDRVLEDVLLQLTIGVVFAALVLAIAPPRSRAEWIGPEGLGMARAASRSMYAMPFFLPLLDRMNRWRKVVVVTAFLLNLTLAVAGANRGMLLTGALILPSLVLAIALRGRRTAGKQFVGLLVISVLAAITALLLSGRGATFGRWFEERFDETTARLTGGDTATENSNVGRAAFTQSQSEFTGEESRGGEVRSFLEQLEAVDLIAGRGFGGTWYSSFWRQEWGMVHIGPAHLLLVGGLPLALVFLAILVRVAASAWRGAVKWPAAAGALLYITTFAIGFMQHGSIQDEIEVYFYWLCCGIALSHRAMWRPFADERNAATEQLRSPGTQPVLSRP